MTDKKDTLFGVHSVTPYNLKTGLPYSKEPFKVLGAFSVSMTQEAVENIGGSSYDPFDVELAGRTSEGALTIRRMPAALLEILTGTKPTENAAEANGSVTPLRNVKGVSALDASIGIASVGLKSGDAVNVPLASYTLIAVSPTTLDVYVSSDVDFKQGAAKSFVAGTHKVNASPLTIATDTAVEIPGFGIELTGGSGTIAMTTGDTAVFESKPANVGSRETNIGDPCDSPPYIGLRAVAQRKVDGVMHDLNIYKARAFGLPLTMTEKAFYEGEITFKPMRAIDIFSGEEGLSKLRSVESSNLTA